MTWCTAHGGGIGLFSSVLPIYWMALAIQRMDASHAAAKDNLGPVLTLFAASLLLGVAVSAHQPAGLALERFGVTHLRPRPPTSLPPGGGSATI